MKKQLKCFAFLTLAMLLSPWGRAGTVTYVYTDPQGTTLAEADASGNITATYDYAPYGSQAMGTTPNGPGYTGHVNDPDTGLVYMQARYYDPGVGRFISVDPIGQVGGSPFTFNRFTYANSNPIVNMDPDGRCTGSHITYGDGTCVSTGENTTQAGNAHSYSSAQAKYQNTLTATVFTPIAKGANGAIDSKITWTLRYASKNGGYIVQRVDLSGSAELGIESENQPYFEAWPVPAASRNTTIVTNGYSNYDDVFHFGGRSGHGHISWKTSARFYEGLTLPKTFVKRGVIYAGDLLSTNIDPKLSTRNATPPVDRELSNSW